MKPKKMLGIVFAGLLTFTAGAQTLAINNIINVALVCQVQQDGPPDATTTKVTINTKSLLQLIADDQGISLPSHAKLWLMNNIFFVMRADNTIFTSIDTNLLNITYGTTVMKSKLVQTNNTYLDTINGTSVLTLTYSGASVSFTLNCAGKNYFYNKADFTKATNNAVVITSFNGKGFGDGTFDGQDMVIAGSVTGKYAFRYTTGGGGGLEIFPIGSGTDGTFPGASQ